MYLRYVTSLWIVRVPIGVAAAVIVGLMVLGLASKPVYAQNDIGVHSAADTEPLSTRAEISVILAFRITEYVPDSRIVISTATTIEGLDDAGLFFNPCANPLDLSFESAPNMCTYDEQANQINCPDPITRFAFAYSCMAELPSLRAYLPVGFSFLLDQPSDQTVDFYFPPPLVVLNSGAPPTEQEAGHLRWIRSDQGNFESLIQLRDTEVRLLHLPVIAGGEP